MSSTLDTNKSSNTCETNALECEKVSTTPALRMRPRVDIMEQEDRYLLKVDLPGVHKDDLDVTLEKETLSLKGVARFDLPEGFRVVSGCGSDRCYERTFRISDEIDREGITVEMKNGVAWLDLPKSAMAQKTKLTVK
ncbi:Hsp20/alpha crystallin family protein [Thalassoglobus polymorphus]|uniref:Spore protein SP21 n=1 Tax=Thalassoglobus polymorphus TaxID=2527994 RepID=A0A517QVN2_9PLAN|nr:Hsp20/alpha crystallin family protein [Thalassoglobus polymorphus]QDT35627.1 Spore protein SP21 [Thalassoglobus polymorphus]